VGRMTIVGVAVVAVAVVSVSWGSPAFAEEEKARDLYGVRWQPSLERALEVATPREGAAKPIVWFRVLGDLDGLT
jgi:hypothetical protein